jgi:hypothetical protein
MPIYTFMNNLRACWKFVTIIKKSVISQSDIYGGFSFLSENFWEAYMSISYSSKLVRWHETLGQPITITLLKGMGHNKHFPMQKSYPQNKEFKCYIQINSGSK